jgi:hypothetical protein
VCAFNLYRGRGRRFRAKPAPPTNITEILEATLKKIRVEELRKKLTVITKNRIRIIA